MANVDLWGTAILLRCLKQQGKITEKEAHKIWPGLLCRLAQILLFLSEFSPFVIAILKVVWYCVCYEKRR